jgi:two-component system KDP operon response regulator KdpE
MKLLIVDDDPMITETVTICFNLSWPESEVIKADRGEEALELARQASPDVILLDISLPGIDGYETLLRLREHSETPVIMLTAHSSEVEKVKGLELGADDYITKPFSHLELLARVRAVLRRTSATSAAPAHGIYRNPQTGLEINFNSREVTRHGQRIKLAPLEYGLLYHLVGNEGKVMSHQTLLAKVWGREYIEEVEYLKVYISRLRTKLGDNPLAPELIHTERGAGYMFQVRHPVSSTSSPTDLVESNT